MSLSHLAKRGFLPRAHETQNAFYQRIAPYLPTNLNEKMKEALFTCQRLFDVEPDWVPLIEGRSKLSFWQGAVLWVDEQEQPLIQVAKCLFYNRDEMIAHELIHAVRLPLASKRFEEIIAYQTSSNWWRRTFGPIIRTPREVYIFLCSLLCSWIPLFWEEAAYLRFATPLVALFALLRLYLTQRVFRRCREKLSLLLGCRRSGLSLTARLTDEEIALFAKWSPQEIRAYILDSKELRWQMLCFCYPALAPRAGSDAQQTTVFGHRAACTENSGVI
jgi:hypothetical protein